MKNVATASMKLKGKDLINIGILVVDDGHIAQCGTHNELMHQEGIYKRFVSIREQAEDWNLVS